MEVFLSFTQCFVIYLDELDVEDQVAVNVHESVGAEVSRMSRGNRSAVPGETQLFPLCCLNHEVLLRFPDLRKK